MRISDWSSDVCSSDLLVDEYQDTDGRQENLLRQILGDNPNVTVVGDEDQLVYTWRHAKIENILEFQQRWDAHSVRLEQNFRSTQRSEEHTSELQSLMRSSYAVFCLKNKNKQ